MSSPNGIDPGGVRLNEAGVSRATTDLLMASSERRKRGRPPTIPDRDSGEAPYGSASQQQRQAESERKRRHVGSGVPGTVNVAAAKRAAATLIRESPTYKRLIDVEEQVDVAIMRKQQDIKDALKNNSYTRTCTFRLYIFNTFRAQPKDGDASDSNSSSAGNDAGDSEDRPDGIGGDNEGSLIGGPASAAKDKENAAAEANVDVSSWSLRLQGQFLEVEEVQATRERAAASAGTPKTRNEAPGEGEGDASGGGASGGARGGAEDGDVSIRDTPMDTSTDTPTGPRVGDNVGPGPVSNDVPTPPRPGQLKNEPGKPLGPKVKAPTHLKCTDVFRKVVIELDKEVYGEKNLIEWNRVAGELASDGFELSRSGDKECTAKIFLYVDNSPERFKMSFVLSRLIGIRCDTRSNVFMAVWQYIKKKKLQCQNDRASVSVDSGLRTLMPSTHVAAEVVKLNHLFEIIKLHMGPADPIQLTYNIKLSGNVVENQACYDIEVEVPDDTLHESAVSTGIFGLTWPNSADFVTLNEKHLEALELVAYHKRRRNFLEEFCSSPVDFINQLILSQTRDLKVINGSSGRNPEEERWASFYQQQWVNEAVPRYLLRKQIADAAKRTAEQPGLSR